jgi:hypothetical protein
MKKAYTISPDMSLQNDLLAAKKADVLSRPSSSNVELNFKHILSQVKFAIVAGDGMTVHLQSIKVKKVGSVRTFDYSSMAWDGTAPTDNTDFSYVAYKGNCPTIEGTNSATAAAVAGTSGTLMLLPQDLSGRKWDKSEAGLSEDQSYIEVVYRMTETNGGKDVVGFTDATKYPGYGTSGSGTTGPLFVKVGYPLPTNWEMSKTYTYTIYLGTPDATGGNLANEDFIDAGGNPDDKLPVVDPSTEEKIDPSDPVVDTSKDLGFIVDVTPWSDYIGTEDDLK